jgi:hypothetical protein
MKKIFLPLIAASVLAVGADLDVLKKECDGGNGASCYELGVLYDNAREGAAQESKGGRALLKGLQIR